MQKLHDARHIFDSAVDGLRWKGDRGIGRCPFHDDRRPSFSVDAKKEVFFCHGCGAKGTLLQFERRMGQPKQKTKKNANEFKFEEEGSIPMKTIEAIYPYLDEAGDLLYQQVRFAPKSFAFRRPAEAGGWVWNLEGITPVLYWLPEVLSADEVFIVEGEKDADGLRKLGLVATCNPGGAGKWTEQYSKCLKGKKVFVLPDDDEPGRKHAQEVARSVASFAAEVRLVPPFANAKDVSEWIKEGGTKKQLMKLVAATSIYRPSADPRIPADATNVQPASPTAPLLRGPKLVGKLEVFFQKRVILPKGLALVIALWVIGTYISDIFDCYPYICITSPAKRCGKTLLAELIGLVSARSKTTVNISEAALFRMIQVFRPTIIMDEAETLANKKSERSQFLLSLLNAGHRKNANVIRCVGKDHVPTEFPVYCPKVLLAIGNPPDTFRDRSVIVAMRRRRKDEHVAKYRYREVSARGRRRAALTEVWAAAHKQEIEAGYLDHPLEFLDDREADNWASLFAIAAVAIPDRLVELQRIAIRLGKAKNALDVDDSDAIRLLTDIRQILESDELSKISTEQLINKLKGKDESPWEDLTAAKLARTLRPFNVAPRQIWVSDGRNVRGYDHDELRPVFDSYLQG